MSKRYRHAPIRPVAPGLPSGLPPGLFSRLLRACAILGLDTGPAVRGSTLWGSHPRERPPLVALIAHILATARERREHVPIFEEDLERCRREIEPEEGTPLEGRFAAMAL